MVVVGADLLASLAAGEVPALKMVFNASGAIIFPAEEQHRDQKAPGISYEDDYRGNALAALLRSGEIEIRFHRDFSDARVKEIVARLVRLGSALISVTR
jgi:hypothetical protein